METGTSCIEHNENNDESSTSDSPHNAQVSNQRENIQESSSVLVQQSRRPNLSSLQIPVRSLDTCLSNFTRIDFPSVPSPISSRPGLPPRPNSAKFKSSVRNLLPQRSFRAKNVSQDGEKTVLVIPDAPSSDGPLDKPSTSRSFSLNKIFFPSSTKAAHSLPATPLATSGLESVRERHQNDQPYNYKFQVQQHMTHSLSVPVNIKVRSLRWTESGGDLIRVISVTPRTETAERTSANNDPATDIATEDAGEDIPEEEAVCRICLVELGGGGDMFKMECSCKGELALAHKECAVKWFSIKGNKTCDVCKQDVRNVPVTLLKIHNPQTVTRRLPPIVQQREVARYRVWQDIPVLVMVSMLAYFCFLEQLLVSNLGPRALAISLPFSCFLGLLSSIIASTMEFLKEFITYDGGSKQELHMGLCVLSVCDCDPVCSYLLFCCKKVELTLFLDFVAYTLFRSVKVVLYAISTVLLNFLKYIFLGWGLVVFIFSIKCSNTQLNVNPILSVLISSFTGFGIAISTNSLIVEYLRWRMSRQMQSLHQQMNGTLQHQQQEQQNQQIQQQQHHQQLTEDHSAELTDSSRQQ